MNNTLRRRKRRESNGIKLIAGIILAAIVLLYIVNIAMGVGTVKGTVDASNKGYVAITVHNEDTLWSIADMYMNDELYTYDTFILEVALINDLNDNQIYAGEQIMIPIFR